MSRDLLKQYGYPSVFLNQYVETVENIFYEQDVVQRAKEKEDYKALLNYSSQETDEGVIVEINYASSEPVCNQSLQLDDSLLCNLSPEWPETKTQLQMGTVPNQETGDFFVDTVIAHVQQYVSLQQLEKVVEASKAFGSLSKNKVEKLALQAKLSHKHIRQNGGYNPNFHLAASLLSPPSSVQDAEGKTYLAKRHEPLPLNQAKALLDSRTIVIVGDVHGNLALLSECLERLGVVENKRRKFNGMLLSIGDLIDGREGSDVPCFQYGRDIFDKIICGNHEAAYIGGPKFDGMPVRDEISGELRRAMWSEQLCVGVQMENWLFTHAGIRTMQTDPGEVFAELSERWYTHCGRPNMADQTLFGIDHFRGGSSPMGGVMWGDWKNRFAKPTSFKQVVGHTPLGNPESDQNDKIYNIDVAGDRLAFAIINGDNVQVASSLQINP